MTEFEGYPVGMAIVYSSHAKGSTWQRGRTRPLASLVLQGCIGGYIAHARHGTVLYELAAMEPMKLSEAAVSLIRRQWSEQAKGHDSAWKSPVLEGECLKCAQEGAHDGEHVYHE